MNPHDPSVDYTIDIHADVLNDLLPGWSTRDIATYVVSVVMFTVAETLRATATTPASTRHDLADQLDLLSAELGAQLP